MTKLSQLADKFENQGVYTVQSNTRSLMYFYNDSEYAISTNNGYIRLTDRQAHAVADEWAQIVKDIDELKREGRR